MTSARNYLVCAALSFTLCAASIAALNYVVDPYFLYDAVSLRCLNIAKPDSANRRTFMGSATCTLRSLCACPNLRQSFLEPSSTYLGVIAALPLL